MLKAIAVLTVVVQMIAVAYIYNIRTRCCAVALFSPLSAVASKDSCCCLLRPGCCALLVHHAGALWLN